MNKEQEKYLKEIAEKINSGRRYEIENPTSEDIKGLKDFDYILVPTRIVDVMIKKDYKIEMVLNIPTVFFTDGYRVSDNIMGEAPFVYQNVDEVLEEIAAYKE